MEKFNFSSNKYFMDFMQLINDDVVFWEKQFVVFIFFGVLRRPHDISGDGGQ